MPCRDMYEYHIVSVFVVMCAVHRAVEERQPRETVVVASHQGSVWSSFLISLVFTVPCWCTDCWGGRWAVRCVVNFTRLHRWLHSPSFLVEFWCDALVSVSLKIRQHDCVSGGFRLCILFLCSYFSLFVCRVYATELCIWRSVVIGQEQPWLWLIDKDSEHSMSQVWFDSIRLTEWVLGGIVMGIRPKLQRKLICLSGGHIGVWSQQQIVLPL